MPAPRTCRACHADLPPSGRACAACGEPVTEFAARAPLHDGVVFDPTRAGTEMSRWRGGPHRLGPLGRVLATVLVILFGPWGSFTFFTLMYTPVWVVVSTIVLKDVWRTTPVMEGSPLVRPPSAIDRFASRHPVLGQKLDRRVGTALVAAAIAVLVVLAIPRVHGPELFALAAVASMVGLGFLLAWLSGI